MLTLLNVPKGTRLLTASSSSSYDCKLTIVMLAPSFGSRAAPGGTVGTHEGYLRESDGLYGQNPVEHLKLGGSIVDLSFSSGTTALDSTGKPSYAGVPWMNIPVNSKKDGTGTNSTLYAQFVVPYGEVMSASARRIIPSGSYAGKLFALYVICGWVDEDTWFTASGTAGEYLTPLSTGWWINWSIGVYKLNFEHVKSGYVSAPLQMTGLTVNPVFSDPAQFVDAVVAKVRVASSTITTYGSDYSTGAYYTRNEPLGLPSIPSFGSFEEKFFPQDLNPDRWGDLASDCYSQIQCWDGNAAAYLRDSVLSVKSAKDTIALAKSVIGGKNPVKVAKSLASLFLSFRYGWCLQAKDTMSLVAIDFDRAYPNGLAKRSASRTYTRNGVPVTARMGVYFQPYSSKISELEGFLRTVDLDFTLENIWDLVPLSFVVDWFTGLGSLLDRMDQMAQLDSFDVRLVGRSLKTTKSLIYQQTSGRSNWQGLVSASYYKRHYQTEPIQPSLLSYRNSNQKFDHWLEGTALIVQRL